MLEESSPEETERSFNSIFDFAEKIYQQPIDEFGIPTEMIATPSANTAQERKSKLIEKLSSGNPDLENANHEVMALCSDYEKAGAEQKAFKVAQIVAKQIQDLLMIHQDEQLRGITDSQTLKKSLLILNNLFRELLTECNIECNPLAEFTKDNGEKIKTGTEFSKEEAELLLQKRIFTSRSTGDKYQVQKLPIIGAITQDKEKGKYLIIALGELMATG